MKQLGGERTDSDTVTVLIIRFDFSFLRLCTNKLCCRLIPSARRGSTGWQLFGRKMKKNIVEKARFRVEHFTATPTRKHPFEWITIIASLVAEETLGRLLLLMALDLC